VPAAGPGEVLVKTEAIGVSYTESGVFPLQLPVTFGFEAAGIVTETGDGVGKALSGRRVVLMNTGLGSYAEYVAVPVAAVTEIPDGLSADDATAVASLPFTWESADESNVASLSASD